MTTISIEFKVSDGRTGAVTMPMSEFLENFLQAGLDMAETMYPEWPSVEDALGRVAWRASDMGGSEGVLDPCGRILEVRRCRS